MGKRHLAEVLIEVNKQISTLITKIQTDDRENNQMIIDEINSFIRKLDEVVEHLEE